MINSLESQPGTRLEGLSPYSADIFFEMFNQDIRDAGPDDRVRIMTMSFEPTEPLVAELCENLKDASQRGVDVGLNLDAYTFLKPGNIYGLTTPFQFGGNVRSQRAQVLDALERSGVHTAVVNPVDTKFANTNSGRSHIKIFLVNNKVYLGGPNLDGTDRYDVVVGFEDETVADFLSNLHDDIAEAGSTREVLGTSDAEFKITDDTKLLIDSGVKNQSIILDEAMELVDDTNEFLLFCSQYFPMGLPLGHLRNAHSRGAEVKIIYNHPSQHSCVRALHRAVLAYQKMNLANPRDFFRNQFPLDLPKLHARVLASEKSATIGSHNFLSTGVSLGTAELNLFSTRPSFVRAVHSLVGQQLQVA